MTITEYPNLQRIRKELSLLQKLYNLYNSVIDNVNGYYDILWQEIDIEKINNELLEYQNRYIEHWLSIFVANAFLSRLELISPISSLKITKMFKKCVFGKKLWESMGQCLKDSW